MSETPGWLTLPTMVHREALDKAVATAKDLRAALDQAEAEKAELRDEILKRACQIDNLRAELATSQAQYHRNLTELANTHLKALDKRSAELAAAKQYGIDCLSAACVTHQSELTAAEAEIDRLRAAYNDVRALNAQIAFNLGAELATMKEALVRADEIVIWMSKYINRMCPPEEGIRNLNEHWLFMERNRTALQSHRRTKETT